MRRNPSWSRNLGRPVYLRPGTSDERVAADVFSGRYHIPPVETHPATVLDLGSNIGLTLADYQRMWPEAYIVGVEPDADNIAVARRHFSGVILERAVSNRLGFRSFKREGLDAEAYRVTDELQGDHIECVTIYHIIKLWFHATGTVDFVKMDIEGEEARVLRDSRMWAPLVNSLLLECHEQINGYGRERAMADLSDVGFKVMPHEAHPQGVWAWKP